MTPVARKKNKRVREPGFEPVANPGLALAMQGLRRSSAASPHTPKPRKGTRSARKERAIDDQER